MATSNQIQPTESRPWNRFNFRDHWRLVIGAFLVLALVGILAGAINLDRKSGDMSSAPAHLLYVDSEGGKLLLADKDGKQTASADFPKGLSPGYQAHSPQGKVLLSLSVGSPNERFLVLDNGKTRELPDEAVKKLRASSLVDNSHNVYFIGEDSVILVDCDSSSCKLSRLNISSGTAEVIADTGVKGQRFSPSVYLVGVSADGSSAFLRVSGSNKLSKDNSALYHINTDTKKVSTTTSLPRDAGYTLSLSPDKKKVVYKTGGMGQPITLHVIDLASGKETKVEWEKLEISNSPSALQWSPDSSKVLIKASSSIFIPTADKDNPTRLAYLDTAENEVTELQTINKTATNTVSYQNWLDNGTIIYEQATASKANDFSTASFKVFTQDISSKKIVEPEAPAGTLERVAFW